MFYSISRTHHILCHYWWADGKYKWGAIWTTWSSKGSFSAQLSICHMFIIWKLLVPVIRCFILIFQPFLCHIKTIKVTETTLSSSLLEVSGWLLDGDNSITLKVSFNCSGCLLDNFSFWIMVQKVFAIISQKKMLFGKNRQIYGLEPLKVLVGTIIQSHYVCCSQFVSVPKENKG